jgi:hypothetical protein
MAGVYYSNVLDRTSDEVWRVVGDFNNYAAYIDGVIGSGMESERTGDGVGAVRSFVFRGRRYASVSSTVPTSTIRLATAPASHFSFRHLLSTKKPSSRLTTKEPCGSPRSLKRQGFRRMVGDLRGRRGGS